VDLNDSFFSSQLPHVIESVQTKTINFRDFLVHDVYEATNAMVNEWCVLVCTICVLADNVLNIFVLAQASASVTWPISFDLTSAQVGSEEKPLAACAVVLG